MSRWLWLLLPLIGCDAGLKGSDSAAAPGTPDVDGDGYTGIDDCDEEDPSVHIYAEEACDGIDNDCDGRTDDSAADAAQLWYHDGDGDGYGGPATVTACFAPAGYVPLPGDCNDADTGFHPQADEPCDTPIDYNCDGAVQYADSDADGFAACLECDDSRADVNPAAPEICDGIDQDCDGSADENPVDAPIRWRDLDGDGWGDPAITLQICDAPDGYVLQAGDCRDADDRYHPGAEEQNCLDPQDYNCDGSTGLTDADADGFVACEDCDDAAAAVRPLQAETCNGIDDDCSGAADDGAGAPSVWYRDVDEDGWGGDATALTACDEPAGYVLSGGDCADTDRDIHPYAEEPDCAGTVDYNCDGSTGEMDEDSDGYPACQDCDDQQEAVWYGGLEICDGFDNDCDGAADEADAADALLWSADADGDRFGDPGLGIYACPVWVEDEDGDPVATPPEGFVYDATDCNDGDPAIYPGALEYCDGRDEDCDGSADEDAEDATATFLDTDSDGDGDPLLVSYVCALQPGYSIDSGDCDDADPSVSSLTPEVCDGADNDCSGAADDNAADAARFARDADGDGWGDAALTVSGCEAPDGYVADATDCDDSDAGISPAGTEICDGIDEDCNGVADDNPLISYPFFPDADGDGWGANRTPRYACTAPAGYVETNTDCDDGDAGINPGERERCDANDTDEDCDTFADEGDPDVAGTRDWYPDADSDGYGDPDAAPTASCDPVSGATLSAQATDCDDARADVNPAAAEICDASGPGGSSTDEDCSGAADDADPSATGQSAFYADADADGYGDPAAARAACDLPAAYVTAAADCDDSRADVNPSAAEVCDAGSTDEDCSGAADDADPSATGQSTFYADADADGYGDPAAARAACDLPAASVSDSTDCDDTDPAVNPAAAEICDPADTDEDCDALTDDADPSVAQASLLTLYPDADDDGYGSAGAPVLRCDAAGYAAGSDDCDDARADVNPGAAEICDASGPGGASTDEDCSGDADDADPGVLAASRARWYVDADADSYGSYSASALACDQPSGYTADGADCDDTDAGINPGAQEICDTASPGGGDADQDCDGLTGDADSSLDPASRLPFYADADADLYGDPAALTLACAPPASYVSDGTDCDDADSDIHPGAQEVCDSAGPGGSGTDEDCDTLTDDDDPTVSALTFYAFYLDADGDGYGTADTEITACDLPTGASTDAADCDDSDPGSNPGAFEVCDALDADEDCDGASDDLDDNTDPATFQGFYADADGDGWGDPSASADRCDATAGFVADDTDCDDADPAISPDAAEVCDPADLDEDCDGAADDNDPSVTGRSTWYADADADNYGAGAGTAACDAPAASALIDGDCDDNTPGVNPGALEICSDGTDQNCAEDCTPLGAAADTAGTLYAGISPATGALGSVAGGADLDGDGIDDLVIGDQLYDTGALAAQLNRGGLWLITGAAGIAPDLSAAPASITGAAAGDRLGRSVALLPDRDGDGTAALLTGAWLADPGGSGSGAALLFDGPLSGALTPADADLTVQGAAAGESAGWITAPVGDIDGDGTPDFAVSAYFYGASGSRGGRVALVSGALSGTLSLDDAAITRVTGAGNERLGATLAPVTDIDGDGQDDLLTGSLGAQSASAFLGPLTADITSADADIALTGLAWSVLGTGETACPSCLTSADLDGDGYTDVLIGADSHDLPGVTNAGEIRVFLGPVRSGQAADLTLTGEIASDALGRSLAAGDINGDGDPDLLIGVPGADTGAANAGAVLLLYGPIPAGSYTAADADLLIYGSAAAQGLGDQVGAVGDVDGDGFGDWAAGAAGYGGVGRVVVGWGAGE